MPVYVDSNVILDILTDDEIFGAWSADILAEYRSHRLWIHPIVYAELSAGSDRTSEVDEILEGLELELTSFSKPALWLAAKAFLKYRASGGSKPSPLPDFLIGAQAEADGLSLITRDVQRFKTYFPKVQLIVPPEKYE